MIARHAPWRMLVDLGGRMSSDMLGIREPFNRTPLLKMAMIEDAVPADALRGRALDIGFNAGYNSIHLAARGMDVVALDVSPANLAMARDLAALAGAAIDFRLADAEAYAEPGRLDLVLHLGTLYHLKNPVRSLENAGASLKRGGWLALETVAYLDGGDDMACLWVYGYNGDRTNTWAIGKGALASMLQVAGFDAPRLVHEAAIPMYKGRMSRVLFVAQKGR